MRIKQSAVRRLISTCVVFVFPMLAGCPSAQPQRTTTGSGEAAGQAQPIGDPISMVAIAVEGNGRVEQTPAGRFLVLEAFPDDGWEFAGWVDVPARQNPVTIIPTADLAVGVRFQLVQASGPATISDSDGDGIANAVDACPDTPAGAASDAAGCAGEQLDNDDDGVSDAADACPGTAFGLDIDDEGCADGQRDDDGDDVTNASDQCADTPAGADVNLVGCAASQLDGDNDGVTNDMDDCPTTPANTPVEDDGCPASVSPPPAPSPPSATCGDGTVGTGEQCEPPGTVTCSATCQLLTPPPPPPPGGGPSAGPATWTSTQFLFSPGAPSTGGAFGPPESYTLDASGTLMNAQISPNAALIAAIFGGGNAAIGATTIPLGSDVELFSVTSDVGFVVTASAVIHEFSLELAPGAATWEFDYTLAFNIDAVGKVLSVTTQFVGQKTGTLDASGTEIEWTNIVGTAFTDELGEVSEQPLDELGYVLGTWSRN